MTAANTAKVAVVWRGDREIRATARPQNNRYNRVFAELRALGVEAEPAVYAEEFEDEVRAQLLDMFPQTTHYEVLTLLARG